MRLRLFIISTALAACFEPAEECFRAELGRVCLAVEELPDGGGGGEGGGAGGQGGGAAQFDGGAAVQPDAGLADLLAEPCLGHDRALNFDGTGHIFDGTQLVTNGSFTVLSAAPDRVDFYIVPANAAQGTHWNVRFAAPPDEVLTPGRYAGAVRYSFEGPGQPGLDVSGNGRACHVLSGSFEIFEYTRNAAGALTSLLVSFSQRCEAQPANLLRGCIRYTP